MRPALFLAVLLLFSCATDAADQSKPNVLFIVSDDLNNFLSCYGDPLAKTPNIDRLAARGVLFERAYCTFPLCGPSRNSMLTGLYPNSTGILTNGQIFRQTIPAQVSLPQAFRRAGYFAARIGKLYHYNVPRSVGTNGHDDPGSWELELNPAGVDRLKEEPMITTLTPGQFGGTLSWYASAEDASKHTDGLMAADAEWVLERCARQPERPFFLAVGFFRPHTPYVAPRDPYFEMHDRQAMPLFPTVEQNPPQVPRAALESYKKEQDQLTDAMRQECVQAYYASISFMDAQVGRVIDSLDRLGLADNTIIVFTSDHGYHMGEHGLWQKMSLFEESARVPLLIVAPGVSGGTIVSSPVSQVDIYPTLAQLAEVETPQNIQGQSLVPMLKDPMTSGRGWALTQVTRSRPRPQNSGAGNRSERYFGYSLRTAQYRYTEWDDGHEGAELYDHGEDSRELVNLADRADYAEIVTQLQATLRTAVSQTYPATGETPKLRNELWAPNLTDP
jgi:iduronate 2-sulfatase